MYDLQLSCSNLKMSAKKRTCTYKRHRYAQIIPYERGLQSLLSLSSMRPVTLLSKLVRHAEPLRNFTPLISECQEQDVSSSQSGRYMV